MDRRCHFLDVPTNMAGVAGTVSHARGGFRRGEAARERSLSDNRTRMRPAKIGTHVRMSRTRSSMGKSTSRGRRRMTIRTSSPRM